MTELLRVSNNSFPPKVAGAIAHILRESSGVDLRAIGPMAIDRCVHSIAIARSYLEEDGFDICARPKVVELLLHGKECTAMVFHLKRMDRPSVDRNGADPALRDRSGRAAPSVTD